MTSIRSHNLGPDSGTVEVHTFREGRGVAQKLGHDLVIDVGQWAATIEAADGDTPTAVSLTVDPRSLRVRSGNGIKALSDQDRADIFKNIDEKILLGQEIMFRSTEVERMEGALRVSGELTLVGVTRPATFELRHSQDGRLTGTLPVTQTDFGITPFTGLGGVLRLRDVIDVVIDVAVPTA